MIVIFSEAGPWPRLNKSELARLPEGGFEYSPKIKPVLDQCWISPFLTRPPHRGFGFTSMSRTKSVLYFCFKLK